MQGERPSLPGAGVVAEAERAVLPMHQAQGRVCSHGDHTVCVAGVQIHSWLPCVEVGLGSCLSGC